MTKEYAHHFYTDEFHTRVIRQHLDWLLETLRQLDIQAVTLCFQYAWGTGHRQWKPFEVQTVDILREIREAESETGGHFGEDDVCIIFDDYNCMIKYCHESDIHFQYDRENKLVTAVLDDFKKRGWELF